MTTPLAIHSINHLARNTSKLEEMRAFYRDVLGFREIQRPPFKFPGAWLFNYGLQIHLIVDESGSQAEAEGEISTRAGHLALHVDDVAAAERTLEKHGIEYRKNEVPLTGVTQLFFHDPDGFHIELATYPATAPFVDGGES